ncbi:MAG: DUF401 family protein, partial [Syntrophomonadaceae bacterium]
MIVLALVISLSTIMYLINKKYPMGLAIFLGSLLLALLAGLTPGVIGEIILTTLSDKNTIELIFSIFFICLLGSMMQGYGVLQKMVEYLEKTFKSVKILLFIIPTLLSTFSVAGSAVFAAPVIDVLGNKVGISAERKAAINLYIRHAWYFVLPISASMIYAAYLADVKVWELIKVQAPVSIVCLITAYLIYIAPLKNEVYVTSSDEAEYNVVQNLKGTLLYTGPLFISVLLVF